MKVRSDFVTNSSSSSFVIFDKSKEYPEYCKPLSKELIKDCVDSILAVYKDVENKLCAEGEKEFLSHIPERIKDYQIFEEGEIKEIAEAFRNEFWSASGVYIPDEIHNDLKRANYDTYYKRPKKEEVETAYAKLTEFCAKNNLDINEIFGNEGISQDYDEVDGWWRYYYDFEYQEALRGNFCIITGENAFSYGVIQFIEDTFGGKVFHLG